MSNAPDEDRTEREREVQERWRDTEAVIAYLSGALRFFGVEKVVVKFIGGFGDASIDVPVYTPPLAGDLPFGLASRIGRLWDSFLPPRVADGSDWLGTLTIDVTAGKIVCELGISDEADWLGDERE
jgi:hypothetical protein